MSELAIDKEPLRQRPGESLMDFTQRVRADMVTEMTVGGLPTENKDRTTLLAALSDIDQQELNKAKIDAKSASTDTQRQAIEIFQQILAGPASKGNPYAKPAIEGTATRVKPLPVLDGNIDLVPGETDVGLASLDLPTFAMRSGMRMDLIPGMAGKGNEEFAPKETVKDADGNSVVEVSFDPDLSPEADDF